MTFLFIFLDGVGLGLDEPETNPFAVAQLPTLSRFLDNRKLLSSNAPYHGAQATLLALDARLDVDGLPQSATGQAALLTGQNVPGQLGYHYGPKPNPEVAAYLKNGNLFNTLVEHDCRAAFLNAYPPRYFEAIESGYRLYAAIPLAVTNAGLPLKTAADLYAGEALSVDFTARGWREQLGFTDSPILSPYQAGVQLANLAQKYDFAFFEYWLSDIAGHRQNMSQAIQLIEILDRVLAGLLDHWEKQSGLILITSDHGNMEDLSTRRHTLNPVPALLFGEQKHRQEFSDGLHDLTGIVPAILRFLELETH